MFSMWVSLPDALRMVRLGSNQLPAYTQPDWSYFWRKPDVRQRAEQLYATVGEASRELDVRVSMHPGQFTVLASDNPDIVNRSIEEFEYHVDIARWMGYGKKFQALKSTSTSPDAKVQPVSKSASTGYPPKRETPSQSKTRKLLGARTHPRTQWTLWSSTRHTSPLV